METGIQDSYDVVVAGAGPAGSSLAIRLATSGLSVLLVEQKRFPREKLCGEFISPECITHFQELGMSEEITNAGAIPLLETVFYSRSGKGVSIRSEWFGTTGSYALGLSRGEMDRMLMERAISVGVDVRDETSVCSLLTENGRVVGVKIKNKYGRSAEVSAKLTVDATGRTRSLARRFRTRIDATGPAKHVAFKTHLRGVRLDAGACEIYVYRGGYGGCNLVEDNLYNLCFIVSAEDTKRLASVAEDVMREIVFTNTRARLAMQDAVVAKPWLAVPIERFGRGELVPADGIIAIGDAAAFIDPFTGSGILVALESAKIAAAAITTSGDKVADFNAIADSYRQNYAAAFNSRLRLCSWLRHASFVPMLAESTLSLLSISTAVRKQLARATRMIPSFRI